MLNQPAVHQANFRFELQSAPGAQVRRSPAACEAYLPRINRDDLKSELFNYQVAEQALALAAGREAAV